MAYKTIFIVDPLKGERIHLAKFIKHEKFTIATFVAVEDCFKKNWQLNADLLIYVFRRGKSEMKPLLEIKEPFRKIPLILMLNADAPEINMVQMKEAGFDNVHKAVSNEKAREIVIELLAPEGLAPRSETPHPVPLPNFAPRAT